MIAEAYSTLDEAIYTVATEAGPRLSEIRGLKVSNVDFEVGVLRFEDGFTTNGGHAGNKGRRVRSVPMTANVRSVLAPFCRGEDREHAGLRARRQTGRADLWHVSLPPVLERRERAGLPRLRLHDLRHTFGTQAIRAFKIHEVQRMMGHRHITTTERYLHYAPDPDAAAKLTALWAEARIATRRPTWFRCAGPPDSAKEGRKEGRAARLRPSFCAAPAPIKGSLWGALASSASSAQAPRAENMPIWRLFS